MKKSLKDKIRILLSEIKITKKIIEFNREPDNYAYYYYFSENMVNLNTMDSMTLKIQYKIYRIELNNKIIIVYPN